jgi:hypothetical protein
MPEKEMLAWGLNMDLSRKGFVRDALGTSAALAAGTIGKHKRVSRY